MTINWENLDEMGNVLEKNNLSKLIQERIEKSE